MLASQRTPKQKEARRLNQVRYRKSEPGRAAIKKYARSAKGRSSQKRWFLKHKESALSKSRESSRLYRKSHRHEEHYRLMKAHHEHKRRQRIKRYPSDVTVDFLIDILKSCTFCPLCGKKMSDDRMSQDGKSIDHIVPLCAMGAHIRSNLRIVCRRCNSGRPHVRKDEDLPEDDE